VQTSIWTKNNKYNFVGDYRYFKYPQNTFGLGSNSNIKDADPMDYYYFRFYETALRHIAGNFYAGVGYILDRHWDIKYQDNSYTRPAFNFYGRPRHSTASGYTLNALFDSRDNAINASSGAYANVVFRTSIKDLGSTSNWQSLIVDVRKYFKFPASSDNVIALWSYDWLVLNGRPSYLDLPSTSWDGNFATGRGYIQGRFRGAQMVYFETEYRFKITANGLLGGVIFGNAQSFSAAQGTKLQSIQPAFGPGLRIKLNKLSKTNIAVDYGLGNQGSKGLFIDVGEAF
jgi:outer membrane protein assembly factor BamA